MYIASDNPDIDDEVEAEVALQRWGMENIQPRIFTAERSTRFRTKHGSHTVAAEGACSSKGRCILAYTDVVDYQNQVSSLWRPSGRSVASHF